jgi:hypothetical protein
MVVVADTQNRILGGHQNSVCHAPVQGGSTGAHHFKTRFAPGKGKVVVNEPSN